MSTSYPDFSLPRMHHSHAEIERSLADFPYLIRTARQRDLSTLADILSKSFHTQDGLKGWFFPLIRMGIQEDLKTRFHAKSKRQVCLVAIDAGSLASNRDSAAPLARQAILMNLPLSTVERAFPSGEVIAGTVEVELRSSPFWSSLEGKHVYISNLAVDANHRRQGIAAQLLTACERVATIWGQTDLYLHVMENNIPAQRLYEKKGYQMQRAEPNLLSSFMRRPRQLLMHKQIG